MKFCKKCQQSLDLNKFGKDKSQKDGLTFYCRSCINSYSRKYSKMNPSILEKSRRRYRENRRQYRDWELKRIFGISIEDYDKILAEQKGVCKICSKIDKKSLSVDHCHESGKIRGLLCSNCNLGIGNFQDDVSLLENTIIYLKKSCS